MKYAIAAIAGALCLAASAGAQQPTSAPPPPPEPSLEFAFEEIVTLAPAISPGTTSRGARRIIPITGGTVKGPLVNGVVMPGGWDWQLDRADGCTDVVADYFIRTDDGVVINVRNTGALCRGQPVRTSPVLEAPVGKYDWMNKTAFVGTLDMPPPGTVEGPAVRIRIYRVR